MNNLIIATGHSRTTKSWVNTKITWNELVKRLKTTTRTPETQGQFKNMSKAQQDNIKDIGGFVGGKLKNGNRRKDSLEKRYIITLDADFADADFCDLIEMLFDFTYCIYSTHKHTPEKPRLRLIIPLSRPCNSDEYEAVSRLIASDIGIDMFDDTTYEAHRLMYWPSTSIDGEYIFKHKENKPIDVDAMLARYTNWKDISEWATSSRTIRKKESLVKNQEDPLLKKGIVGAFCRTYDIDDAIEKFIPDIYSKCSIQDRYTYVNGSSAAGLIVYENSKFAYSNHATDPAGGTLCNAFDLVRIHKFRELDESAVEGTPGVKMPSYKSMKELASNDKDVKLTIHNERLEETKDDFKDIEIEDEVNNDWIATLAVNDNGKNLSTIDNAKKVLVNDNLLKNKVALNEFTQKYIVFGSLAWNGDKKERDWKDADDAGLRHYMEVRYDIKGRNIISDAWVLIANENKFNPVKTYLSELKWDKEKRIDTLFIDYFGAEDNKYTRMSTRKSLTAAVARVLEPGIKYDNVLVLVGPQGQGKSQIFKRLGQEWFSDSLTTMQGKEAYEQIQGFWIIEIAEMSAMKKSEVESIKNFISKSEDAYRAAYGRHIESHKRQCVFFATTNNYEFLKDKTGNRRFWPIDVDTRKAKKDLWKDLDKSTVNQIWAEAVEAYKNGETIYFDNEEIRKLAEIEQDNHLEESPLAGDVKEYLEMLIPVEWDKMSLSDRRMFIQQDDFEQRYKGTVKREKVCVMEIWCEMFNGERKELTAQRSKEIKDVILKTNNWEQAKACIRFGKLYGPQKGFIRNT